MKPLTQLFRQPIRTALALILLTASAAFLCLGWGVFRSAKATASEIDGSFVTIAQMGPNYGTARQETFERDPETGEYVSTLGDEVLTETIREEKPDGGTSIFCRLTDIRVSDYEEALETCPQLRGVYRQSFLSACVPGLRTLTSATSGTRYYQLKDIPYTRAVFTVKLTGIKTGSVSIPDDGIPRMDMDGSLSSGDRTSYYFEIEGDIVDCLALHPDYELRERVKILRIFDSVEERDDAVEEMEIGGIYIVNGENYNDDALWLKTTLLTRAMKEAGITTADMDLNDLEYVLDPYTGEYMTHYSHPSGYGSGIFEDYMDYVGRCSVLVSERVQEGEDRDGASYGVTMARVEGKAEDFLAAPENAEWARFVEDANRQYCSVPVIGTDLLKSLFLFHENTAYLTRGREFEPSDYAEGRRVCLISESLAQANGLQVGDKLTLGLYNGENNWASMEDKYNVKYNAQIFEMDTEIQDTREYEIIGIYAHTEEWNEGEYNLSPNTVFVPNASLAGLETYTDNALLVSVVIKNGQQAQMEAFFAEKGWPEDLLVYFDGGYSEISETMDGFMDSPRQLFLVAAATFLVIAGAYIALFVTRQRRNAGLMLSLGAGKKRATGFVFVTSLIPAVVASVFGAALGALYLNRAVDRVFSEAVTSGDFAQLVRVEPTSAILACLAMFLIYFLLLGAASALLCRRGPLKLLKK